MTTANVQFDSRLPTRIVFGVDSVLRVGELAKQCGMSRVLLVTDKHIEQFGHHEVVRSSLQAQGIDAITFDAVIENPTTREVEACRAVAADAGIDASGGGIVGLGGGSSLDTAKGCNFVLTNGGRMQDYWGVGKASQPMLPMIAIPTTAGTGSECQSFALIADEDTHQKMACGDPKASAKMAVLDPRLTVTQPRRVAACTGVDALAHALETLVTTKRNTLSLMYAREAFGLISTNLDRVLNGDGLTARGAMQLGAAFAGCAIENSMLGAAHSAANPLTARYNVVHGEAVGLMLPHVVRLNAAEDDARTAYAQLARENALTLDESDQNAVNTLVRHIDGLLKQADLARCLTDCDVPRESIATLAAEAATQWTAQFNPRPVSEEDFATLYKAAFLLPCEASR